MSFLIENLHLSIESAFKSKSALQRLTKDRPEVDLGCLLLLLNGSAAQSRIVSARRRNQHVRHSESVLWRTRRPHTGGQAARYSTASVVRRVLRLRPVLAVRLQRMLRRREYLRQGLRGYRARRMIRDDWPVLCASRRFVRV